MKHNSNILLIDNWVCSNLEDKLSTIQLINQEIGKNFEFVEFLEPEKSILQIPTFRHLPTNTIWCLILGGEFEMGLSSNEEKYARAICDPPPMNIDVMRPCHREFVSPFLMMQFPVSNLFFTTYISIPQKLIRPEFKGAPNQTPAFLLRNEVELLSRETGFSLPNEKQWEYGCRGGTQSLFFFGNLLPEEGEIEPFISSDFSRIHEFKSNDFGLFSLFVGEWCKDYFTPSYSSIANEKETFVIRGGASLFWPWQDSGEWVFCTSAMRMPSTNLFGGVACLRLVINLDWEDSIKNL